MNESSEDKKILVDTDWKAQVEAEKEALRRQEQAQPSPGKEAPSGRAASARPAGEEAAPAASFPLLVTSLATQAMMALGQIPDPFENKAVVRLSHARHHIDMLGVLEEKTKGNLTSQEQAMLSHVLTDLRMAYVQVENYVKKAGENPAK